MKRIINLMASRVLTVLFMAVFAALLAAPAMAAGESVSYAGHVEDIGWMDKVSNGELCGTTGESKRLEAVKINLENMPNTSVEYQVHSSDLGWMDYVKDDEVGGTTGQAKRLEALRIKLNGSGANDYDIYYRVHAQDIGWMGWAKNDEPAGTSGMAKRLEALEIRLVPKGNDAPGDTANSYQEGNSPEQTPEAPSTPETGNATVSYSAFIDGRGWQAPVENGGLAGTTGEATKLTAFQATLSNVPGEIQYNAHIEDKGWVTPLKDGEIMGSTTESLQIEALQFVLAGEAQNLYDVYYRTHSSDVGWLDWASNGASAGTSGGHKTIEAFEIQLVPKGEPAPGETSEPFKDLTAETAAPENPTPAEPSAPTNNLVSATPGLRTVKNFLATSLMPIGHTLYIFGGAWNEEDTGAGTPAVTIGLWPQWQSFYDSHISPDYNLDLYDFQIYDGVDCSGYVGWVMYNTLNDTNGGQGEVELANIEAEWYAQKGYGHYTPHRQITSYEPGDIVSLSSHVYISLGQCDDGSVLLVHSSNPGVMITGTRGPNGEETEATRLSHEYMSRYYPQFYQCFADRLDRNVDPYLTDGDKFTWDTQNICGDPDGIRNLKPEQVLKVLFNEQ